MDRLDVSEAEGMSNCNEVERGLGSDSYVFGVTRCLVILLLLEA